MRFQDEPLNPFVLLITCITATTGLMFGYNTGVISGALLFFRDEFHLTGQMQGAVVGAILIGGFLGALLCSRVADFWGRRYLLILTAFVSVVGALGSALSQTYGVLLAGRFLMGIGIGIASFIAPVYLAEIAPAKYRGLLVSLNQLAITLGIMLAYAIDFYYSNTGAWRWMLGWGAIPPLLLLVSLPLLPESPRWLIYKGRSLEAHELLQKLRHSLHVNKEFEEIKSTSVGRRHTAGLLFKSSIRPALFMGIMLVFLQQCTGINTIIYFAPTIFQMLGLSSKAIAILATVGIGAVNVIFTVFMLPLIDRWGRRPLLLLALIGITISLVVLAFAFCFGAGDIQVPFIAMLLFIACFAMGLGPIPWLMLPELFPLEVRSLGTGIATAFMWGFNALVAISFFPSVKWVGIDGTFMIYALIGLLGSLFVYAKLPETKGKTLESIEQHLRKSVKLRRL